MTQLVLTVRDGMFLKDGREWATVVARSLDWPMPSTLLGALRTALGRMNEAARGKALRSDEWAELADATRLDASVALRRPLAVGGASLGLHHRVWPVPTDALFIGDDGEPSAEVRRLEPRPAPCRSMGRDDDEAREALWWPVAEVVGKPSPPPAWWPEAAMIAWLTDDAGQRPRAGMFAGLAMRRHVRVHVGIDPVTQAGQDDVLFAHDVVETLDRDRAEWLIACEFSHEGKAPVGLATLGSDRRPLGVEKAGTDLLACPGDVAQAFSRSRPKGLRLVAVTPCAFERGWLPDGFRTEGNEFRGQLPGVGAEVILRAAFVLRASHVSGWDMALGRPKPTTRLVPPGSVFHVVKTDGSAFSAEEAKNLWLAALGGRTAEGFGRVLPGLWNC